MTADKPFVFMTQLPLVLLTGFKAADIVQLRDCLEKVPESSVYYHTHNFLRQHQFLVQEPPNDFAYWITHVLNEERLGERLAAVDTIAFHSLGALRRALLDALEPYAKGSQPLRKAPPEQEFYFMKAILFDMKTPYTARTLKEFIQHLKKISIYSIYYHMFESRLRTSHGVNDFSFWLNAMGHAELAQQIQRLDPYFHTMEGLRSRILTLLEKKMAQEEVHVPAQ